QTESQMTDFTQLFFGQALIDLNVALRDKYGINISNAMIADEFEVRHVDDDMLSILGLVNSALS
ncbi:hypothetical protein, partial [Ensifer sp. 22564]|uniref:hypothetical protein n=1 Tax=Ensifer sp. 22564 TaxID=3453943 RepID=UPI003F8498C5